MLLTPRKATIVAVVLVILTVLLILWIKTGDQARAGVELRTEAEYEYVDTEEEPEYKEDKLWDEFDPNEVKPDKDIFFISSSGYVAVSLLWL